MINALSVDKIGKLLNGINMNGVNFQKTNVGVNLHQRRMTRIRHDAENEIIQMRTELEDENLKKVVNSEKDIIWSFDGMYSDRNYKAQAMLGTMFSEYEDEDGSTKKVCIGSCVLKRKGRLSEELAKTAPGIVVDLQPNELETYALQHCAKRMRCATDRQTYICTAQGYEYVI